MYVFGGDEWQPTDEEHKM